MARGRTRITHLVPHTGGGVGAFLYSALKYELFGEAAEHVILQLLEPRDRRALSVIEREGLAHVLIGVGPEELSQVARSSDLLVVHWWHHPALVAALDSIRGQKIRTLVWSHVSGIHAPLIPLTLVAAADAVVASSGVSSQHLRVRAHHAGIDSGKIFHCYSFGDLAPFLASFRAHRPNRLAYAGTIDFSKMSSSFVELLPDLEPRTEVWLFGHASARSELQEMAALRHELRLHFAGHSDALAEQLSDFGIFFYPLESCHYGTTENVLQEAMALGLVPVVRANPTEVEILGSMAPDFCVSTREDTTQILRRLASPESRATAAEEAHSVVADRWRDWLLSHAVRDLVESILSLARRELSWSMGPQIARLELTDWLNELAHFDCGEAICRSAVTLLQADEPAQDRDLLQHTTWRLWEQALRCE